MTRVKHSVAAAILIFCAWVVAGPSSGALLETSESAHPTEPAQRRATMPAQQARAIRRARKIAMDKAMVRTDVRELVGQTVATIWPGKRQPHIELNGAGCVEFALKRNGHTRQLYVDFERFVPPLQAALVEELRAEATTAGML